MEATKSSLCKFIDRRVHIDQLRHSKKHNVRGIVKPAAVIRQRHDEDEEGLPAGAMPMKQLVASIKALGTLLLPLIILKIEGEGEEFYEVAAGGRRLTALLTLWKAGELEDPFIPVREVESGDPALISLTENVNREPMHPADECAAFGRLLDGGFSVDSISAQFGLKGREVQQRLALGKLHPELLREFRAGNMGMDAAQAYASDMDRAHQLAVWKKLSNYNRRNAHLVRDALTEQDFTMGHRLVRLVGADAYRLAGGEVREDLFASEDGADRFVLTDPGLVDTLAAAMLEEKAEELRAQGWGWVELITDNHPHDHAHRNKLQKVARGEAAKDASGWYVYVTHDGQLQTDGPYMSKAAVQAKARASAKSGAGGEGEGDEKSVDKVPESLMRSLTAHKSAALQCALLGNPRVTMALLAARLMSVSYFQSLPLHVRFDDKSSDISREARGYENTRAAGELQKAEAAWEGRVGEDALAYFLSQDVSVSLEAIAYVTARSFSMINASQGSPYGVEAITQALGFNLADYFKPTAATYLAQVPKAKLVEAVTQAVNAEAAAPLSAMKKDMAVAAAETQLASTTWVPEAIR